MPKFNWELNLGHVLQMLTMFCAIIFGWLSIEKRILVVESRASANYDAQVEMRSNIKTLTDSQINLTRQVDRIAVIIERK